MLNVIIYFTFIAMVIAASYDNAIVFVSIPFFVAILTVWIYARSFELRDQLDEAMAASLVRISKGE